MVDIARKVKAKYQKAKGRMQMKQGDTVSGAFEKMKGSVNDVISDNDTPDKDKRTRDNR